MSNETAPLAELCVGLVLVSFAVYGTWIDEMLFVASMLGALTGLAIARGVMRYAYE